MDNLQVSIALSNLSAVATDSNIQVIPSGINVVEPRNVPLVFNLIFDVTL